MPVTMESLGISNLPRDERIALVQEIWDSIAAEPPAPLSRAKKDELDRRIADIDADPEGYTPWEDVKARLLAKRTKS